MGRPVTKLPRIEETAIRLFANRGLGQVTIKDIAREAGCAEGALYRHYASKKEMAWTLFRREVEHFARKVRSVWFVSGSFKQKLGKGIRLFYKFFDEDPLAFSFVLLSQHDFPATKKLNPELSPDNIVLYFVREGIKSGEFQISDAKLAAAMVLGTVLEPATLRAKGKLRGRMEPRSQAVTEACLRILKAKNVRAGRGQISKSRKLVGDKA